MNSPEFGFQFEVPTDYHTLAPGNRQRSSQPDESSDHGFDGTNDFDSSDFGMYPPEQIVPGLPFNSGINTQFGIRLTLVELQIGDSNQDFDFGLDDCEIVQPGSHPNPSQFYGTRPKPDRRLSS